MVKDTSELGATVSAVSEVVASPAHAQPGQQQQHQPPQQPAPGDGSKEAVGAPVLTDWKIEMNPRQEYSDPITCHYVYAGGVEGNTVIEWFR